jgi:hypothetical protein
MMHTPLMITPAQGWVPGGFVVVVVVDVDVVVVEVVVVDVVVVDVAGWVVVVVVEVVVDVAVVEVAPVEDVVDEPAGGVLPPMVDGTHRLRSGVNRRDRFAKLTSKQTNAGAPLTAAGVTVGPVVAGTHNRLGSSTRSRSRSPIFTGNGGAKRTAGNGG